MERNRFQTNAGRPRIHANPRGPSEMLRLRTLIASTLGLLVGQHALATNWQLVWSDEFNGKIGPDWVFETGGGGWGNNELEYYRSQNAKVVNNALVITAKKEEYGGYH